MFICNYNESIVLEAPVVIQIVFMFITKTHLRTAYSSTAHTSTAYSSTGRLISTSAGNCREYLTQCISARNGEYTGTETDPSDDTPV